MSISYTKLENFDISSFGYGCSRLGSMMGASKAESEIIINTALNRGITFFDTASSYGQGDSERILGRLVAGDDKICLVSKIGKQVPLKAKLLQPVKTVLRKFSRNSSQMTRGIRRSRGKTLPTNFEITFLQSEFDKSRRRLGVDCIPMMMLHSISADNISKGDAVQFLDRQKDAGNIRILGVSVDDIDAANAAISDPRIKAIQAPLFPNDEEMQEWATRAKASNKLVIAREIFEGIQDLNNTDKKPFIEKNLDRVRDDTAIDVSLIGTTKIAHLNEMLDYLAK